LSNTLDGEFCLEALLPGWPKNFNTAHSSQFTAGEYTDCLEEAGVAVGRDGRGQALDNVLVEQPRSSINHYDISISLRD
jgi:transposase InsO family protein